jgi:hypothetical protein
MINCIIEFVRYASFVFLSFFWIVGVSIQRSRNAIDYSGIDREVVPMLLSHLKSVAREEERIKRILVFISGQEA